jgi:hypothetical protein
MLRKLSLVLACGVLASWFSMNAQASPFSSVRPQPTAPVIALVRDGCGLGFHWAACGCEGRKTSASAGAFQTQGAWADAVCDTKETRPAGAQAGFPVSRISADAGCRFRFPNHRLGFNPR